MDNNMVFILFEQIVLKGSLNGTVAIRLESSFKVYVPNH